MADQTWPSSAKSFRKIHSFLVEGGMKANLLRVQLDKRQGWQLVMELLTKLQQDEFLIDMHFAGRMEEVDE